MYASGTTRPYVIKHKEYSHSTWCLVSCLCPFLSPDDKYIVGRTYALFTFVFFIVLACISNRNVRFRTCGVKNVEQRAIIKGNLEMGILREKIGS